MGRYTGSNAKGHKVLDLGHGTYRLSWVIDRYYPRSRLRHPTGYSRITDEAGAKRLCKKWGVEIRRFPANDGATR